MWPTRQLSNHPSLADGTISFDYSWVTLTVPIVLRAPLRFMSKGHNHLVYRNSETNTPTPNWGLVWCMICSERLCRYSKYLCSYNCFSVWYQSFMWTFIIPILAQNHPPPPQIKRLDSFRTIFQMKKSFRKYLSNLCFSKTSGHPDVILGKHWVWIGCKLGGVVIKLNENHEGFLIMKTWGVTH